MLHLLRPVGQREQITFKKGRVASVSDFHKAIFNARRLQRNVYRLLSEDQVSHKYYRMSCKYKVAVKVVKEHKEYIASMSFWEQ